jgi:transcriptional regulator with PAS, ATPase and Fis domain
MERTGEPVLLAREPVRRAPPGDAMLAVQRMIDCVASTDATVLVLGESGVGKALVARALHDQSPRRGGPFLKVNCAALPHDLLESELFGYERGAFTGADRMRAGRFELAHQGTIVLDEIGEMPMALQAKLLHVLQDGAFTRLGGGQDVRVDVRIVAATNRDLARLVERGEFRADLYYRLNVVSIVVPPLRERPEEIPFLIDHFLTEHAREYARPRRTISPRGWQRLLDHSWPGNVRELENAIKRIVLLENEDGALERVVASRPMGQPRIAAVPAQPVEPASSESDAGPALGLKEIAQRAALAAEAATIRQVLERVHWNRVEAARMLRISYKTLLRKMACHLDRSDAPDRGAPRLLAHVGRRARASRPPAA